MSNDPLLQPYRLKHLTLRNRIMSTAHEPAYSEDGLPKQRYRLYHAEKAKGGIALTMTAGSAVVGRDSPEAFGNLHAYRDEIVPWLQELSDACHEHGAAVMMQITHLGRRTNWNKADWLPVLAPSAVREPAHHAFPKVAEDWDLDRIVGQYADAAERMQAGGLDGIEIEAYGHLLDGFWSPATNQRDDEYGGSLDNRLRFTWRVLDAIRDRVGAHFIVGLRMVADEDWDKGLSRQDGVEIARRLADSGKVDFLNLIRGHIETDAALSRVIPIQGTPAAPHIDFCGEVRAVTKFPVFHAARISDVATARHAVAEGKLDMVGMTRAHIADPHIVNKVASGRERTLPHVIAKTDGPRRRIAVVGSGPGGLEAARVCAERGHEVVLFEAADQPGGQIRLAARLPRRRELIGITDWRAEQCQRLGVDMRFNVYAEAGDVLSERPDVILIATGGLPNTEIVDGAELTVSTWDILSGDVKPGDRVLIYDDNAAHQGLSAAEFVAGAGATITINKRVRAVRRAGNGLVAEIGSDYSDRVETREVDQVVVEHGTLPLDDLYFALKADSRNLGELDYDALIAGQPQAVTRNTDGGYQLFRIGDAVASRNIHAAIYDAARLAKDL